MEEGRLARVVLIILDVEVSVVKESFGFLLSKLVLSCAITFRAIKVCATTA